MSYIKYTQQQRRNLIGQNLNQQLKTFASLAWAGGGCKDKILLILITVGSWILMKIQIMRIYLYETGEVNAGRSVYIQQSCCWKPDSLNWTISLYKCSLITFITVKDQPVTSVEKHVTNDSTEISNKHFIFYFETSISDWESMCRVG